MLNIKQKLNILLIFGTVAVMTSCNNTSFDSVKWKNWDGKESFVRWDMTDDLINKYDLKAKTQNEIKILLGEPDNGINSDKNNYYYDLGPCRNGIDYGSLTIHFKNKKVTKIEKHCS